MTLHKTLQSRCRQVIVTLIIITATTLMVGCELDSFLNPSVVGRWEYTPVKLPILDRLDVIDEPDPRPVGLSQVQPEDLIVDVREYTIESGDILSISIFELVELSREWAQGRRVDAVGNIRLPYVGEISVLGKSASAIEQKISDGLEEKGILRDATVSVLVTQQMGRMYYVITEPRTSGTMSAPFPMEKPYYTLYEAISRARGIDNQLDRIYVIRQVPIKPADNIDILTPADDSQTNDLEPADLIDDLFKGIDSQDQQQQQKTPAPALAPPKPLDKALDHNSNDTQWKYENGKWVAANQPRMIKQKIKSDNGEETQEQIIAQRVIEIPVRKLLDGDLQYNIIIRPGDIIRIPGRTSGVCYVSGAVNNPGVFAVPGNQEMTLMNLIGGPARGISGLGVPEKVDLIRRIDRDQVAIMRLDLKAIYQGHQPDIFIKPNDQINVGQTFWSYPLAVFRNGFRTSYGFGFLLDRNFANTIY